MNTCIDIGIYIMPTYVLFTTVLCSKGMIYCIERWENMLDVGFDMGVYLFFGMSR